MSVLARQGRRVQQLWMRCAAELGAMVEARSGAAHLEDLPPYTVRHGGVAIEVGRFYGRPGRSRRKALFTRIRCDRTTHTADTYALYEARVGRHLRPRLDGASERAHPGDAALAERYRIDCQSPERVLARLVPPIPELLAQVEPALIRADRREIALFLWGLVCDDETIADAAALVRRLAVEIETRAAGPYR